MEVAILCRVINLFHGSPADVLGYVKGLPHENNPSCKPYLCVGFAGLQIGGWGHYPDIRWNLCRLCEWQDDHNLIQSIWWRDS